MIKLLISIDFSSNLEGIIHEFNIGVSLFFLNLDGA